MRRHHVGSGRRLVVPGDWAAHHMDAAEGFMSGATVTIRQPDGPAVWDPVLHKSVPTAGALLSAAIPAKVTTLTEGSVQPTDVVDEQVRVIGYRVSVSDSATAGVLFKPGQAVTVNSCDDSLLVGRTMTVTDVVLGAHRFERDLYCDLNN